MSYTPTNNEKWHSFYRNPADDVILKSNDNVIFRASSYHLCASSTFFEHLLSLGSVGGANEAIPIDTTSTILEIFLKYVYSAPSSQIQRHFSSGSVWLEVYDLARTLDCPDIARRILATIDGTRLSQAEYWDLMRKLSEKNDVESARKVLEHLRSRHLTGGKFWDRLATLDSAWAAAIEGELLRDPFDRSVKIPRYDFCPHRNGNVPTQRHGARWASSFDPSPVQQASTSTSTSTAAAAASRNTVVSRSSAAADLTACYEGLALPRIKYSFNRRDS